MATQPMEHRGGSPPQVYERPSPLTKNRGAVVAGTIAVLVVAALLIWWIAAT
jgi:hypothetical protein